MTTNAAQFTKPEKRYVGSRVSSITSPRWLADLASAETRNLIAGALALVVGLVTEKLKRRDDFFLPRERAGDAIAFGVE